MRRPPKSFWLLAVCAALISGCAAYAYDDTYAYNDPYYDRPSRYYYDYGPTYYYGPRVYAQPSIGFGFGYHRWRGR